jgi:predicted ATPase
MFRILSFTIHKHPLLGGKKFDLTNPVEDKAENYYSVIIGPNGTGKSYLLNSIIEVFNEIVLFKGNPDYKFKKKFTISYTLQNDEFTVSTEGKEPVYKREKSDISVSELKLPAKWLASSVTINDKYPILNNDRKKQIPQYNYLGIRSASNNAFVSRIKINAVLYLLDILQKNNEKRLLTVYKTLSLKPEIQVVFIGGPMLKMEKKDKTYVLFKTHDKIIEAHRSFLKKNKSSTNYRVARYLKYLEGSEMPDRIFQFMKANENVFQKYSKAGMQLRYRINLDTDSGIEKIKEDWDILLAMLDLELIKISKFMITKDSEFKFEEASSGEGHLLTSIHGILANIEDNSLVIIDEPEVSLHPNWQIDYFDILKSLVDNYIEV